MTTVSGFDHVGIYAKDMEASAQWYEQHLGMQRASANDHHIFMKMTDGQVLAIFQASNDEQVGSGIQHFAYALAEGDQAEAIASLSAAGVSIEQVGPSKGCRDLDGYRIHFV